MTWRIVSLMAPWVERSHFSAILLPSGAVMIMGGQKLNGNYTLLEKFNDVWTFEDNAAWREVSDAAPWPARSGFGAIALQDGNVLVMGGQSSGMQCLNDVWAADFSSQQELLPLAV